MIKSKIICVVGPSGCGKTSLVNFIEKTTGIKTLVSYTTRPIRPDEKNGINHWYVNEDEMPEKSDMLAYTMFNGYHYWVNINDVPEQGIVTYVIDEKGLTYLMKHFRDVFDIFSIYIKRDQKLLIQSVGKDRVERDQDRIKIEDSKYDAVIDNNGSISDFLDTASKVIAILIR